jgi:hypothetical protein
MPKGDPMNLSDLTSRVVKVKVTLPYNREIEIPVGTLTYAEFNSVTADVPDPVIPRTLLGKDGEKLPNRDDVTYKAAIEKANEERSYRRLAIALNKGGVEITGETIAEKAATLRTDLDAGVANALMSFLAQAALGGRVAAQATADTFHK